MNYLLDTHTFLWSLLSTKKISNKAKRILTDPETTKYVSVISFWEISLKFSLGKMTLIGILPEELPAVAIKSGFKILPLGPKIAASFYKLKKMKHSDPFDRMLTWQAIREDCILVTKDTALTDYEPYGLSIVW